MPLDYDAMNERMKELTERNTQVIGGTPPETQQQTYKVGLGKEVTTTPQEYEQIQKALSGQHFRLGDQGGSGRGVPSFSTDDSGQQTMSMLYNPRTTSSTTKSFNLNDPRAQSENQLAQMLSNAGMTDPASVTQGMSTQEKNQLTAGMLDYGAQKESFQQQSQNYAAGLQTMGESVTSMGQELDQTAVLIKEQMTSGLSPTWERAIGKADEFVTNAQNRTVEVMRQFDETVASIRDDMQFEKAHAMQVAAQSAIGQMNSYGDTISRRYGQDSAEYQQFTQQKKSTLATTQSSIHDMYGKINANLNLQVLSGRTSQTDRMAMFENYNEQAALDVYKSAAVADQKFSLDSTNQLISIEQLKMSGQTLLADWMANTPVFSMSLSGIFALLD